MAVQDCVTAFENLEGVKEVDCRRSSVSTMGGATYTVTFREWPDIPHQNNAFRHTGNPPLSYFSCDVSHAWGNNVTCLITDAQSAKIKGGVRCCS